MSFNPLGSKKYVLLVQHSFIQYSCTKFYGGKAYLKYINESLVFKFFNIETLYIYHKNKLNVQLFFLTYICEGKSDIRLNLVRYQSDLGHLIPKNQTYFRDKLCQTWSKSHRAL